MEASLHEGDFWIAMTSYVTVTGGKVNAHTAAGFERTLFCCTTCAFMEASQSCTKETDPYHRRSHACTKKHIYMSSDECVLALKELKV